MNDSEKLKILLGLIVSILDDGQEWRSHGALQWIYDEYNKQTGN
jgi:hypothetical protein